MKNTEVNRSLEELNRYKIAQAERAAREARDAAAQQDAQDNSSNQTAAEADFQQQVRNNPKPFGRSK